MLSLSCGSLSSITRLRSSALVFTSNSSCFPLEWVNEPNSTNVVSSAESCFHKALSDVVFIAFKNNSVILLTELCLPLSNALLSLNRDRLLIILSTLSLSEDRIILLSLFHHAPLIPKNVFTSIAVPSSRRFL